MLSARRRRDAVPTPKSRPDPFTGEPLFADVETYSGFSEQRTGGAADARTADWIAERFATAGLTVRNQPFQVRQFFPTTWSLSVDGVQIPCFPPWWPAPGGTDAIDAALVNGGQASTVHISYSILLSNYYNYL